MLKRIIISLLIIIIGIFYHQPINAKTIIEEKSSCIYQVNVSIVFDFTEDISILQAESKADQWINTIDTVWNNNPGVRQYGDQCQVEYIFVAKIMPPNQKCEDYPNDHCFLVIKDKYNARGNIADAQIIKPNSGLNSWGEWSFDISGYTAAHEIGHAMGLFDEYFYKTVNNNNLHVNENYQLSGPQSIMAQTWGNVSALPEHTDQIMSLAGINPNCQKAEFTNIINNKYELELSHNIIKPQSNNYYSTPTGQNIYLDKIDISLLKGSLVKGQTDSAVYYVDDQGQLRWVKNEQTAVTIFGSDWEKHIIWFLDAIIYSYQFGQEIKI